MTARRENFGRSVVDRHTNETLHTHTHTHTQERVSAPRGPLALGMKNVKTAEQRSEPVQ